jgi:hypothetical protein
MGGGVWQLIAIFDKVKEFPGTCNLSRFLGGHNQAKNTGPGPQKTGTNNN